MKGERSKILAFLDQYARSKRSNLFVCVVCPIAFSLLPIVFITNYKDQIISGLGLNNDKADMLAWVALAMAIVNLVASATFFSTRMRRRASQRDMFMQRANALTDILASQEIKKTSIVLILSLLIIVAILSINRFFDPLTDSSEFLGAIWIVLLPAALSCVQTLIINVRVFVGEFGFNSFEGMELVKLLKKRGSLPGGPKPRIFRNPLQRKTAGYLSDPENAKAG